MVIREMTLEECHNALAQASIARLACGWEGQPYIVPVYLIYDGNYLYGFSTLGRKIEWMRANSHVCVEIDDVKSQNQWISVVVYGTYEELPDTPEHGAARLHAYELLKRRAMWWEPAYVADAHRDDSKSLAPIFYRIQLDRVTGHRASPDPVEVQLALPTQDRSWLRRLLDRIAELRPRAEGRAQAAAGQVHQRLGSRSTLRARGESRLSPRSSGHRHHS